MKRHSRRHFLEVSSLAALGIGTGAGTFLFSGCDPSSSAMEIDPGMGNWEMIPSVPVSAWTAALLPTGKVLLFHDRDRCYLWDPETREFGERFSAHTDVYCAGMAMLGDGRLMAVGGNAGRDLNDEFLGLASAEIFDPWEENWQRVPDMPSGERWYPTAVTLSDGRVLTASGTHAGEINDSIEVFDPESEEWTEIARRELPIYPWAAVLPGQQLIFYGPMQHSLYLDWHSGSFLSGGSLSRGRGGGAGVVLDGRSGELLAVGGGQPVSNTAEYYDPDTQRWQPIPSMQFSRYNPDLVLLPDGYLMATGGHSSLEDRQDPVSDGDILESEVLDPGHNGWEIAGRANFGHGYHSTALLLPDGSVLAAGPSTTLEIFHPWYTHAENRPRITQWANTVSYGEEFSVRTENAPGIFRVVLIRSSSVTHSLNTDQRYLELNFTIEDSTLLVAESPASPGMAPPGYYMLFLVDENGVPSEAEFVKIEDTA